MRPSIRVSSIMGYRSIEEASCPAPWIARLVSSVFRPILPCHRSSSKLLQACQAAPKPFLYSGLGAWRLPAKSLLFPPKDVAPLPLYLARSWVIAAPVNRLRARRTKNADPGGARAREILRPPQGGRWRGFQRRPRRGCRLAGPQRRRQDHELSNDHRPDHSL